MEERKAILAIGQRRASFVALIAYYVFVLYLVPSTAIVERFSFTYFALIIPAWLFVAYNWKYLLTGYSLASLFMALFAILAGLLGLLRWDVPLIYNAVFLAGIAIVILNSKVYLTLAELNWIFLGAIAGSVVVYGLGITEYGFLLGQADAPSCHISMNWRVSLFRVTAESAMFSLVILIANMAYGDHLRGWIRGLVIFIAAYFLVFSGLRSILGPALIAVIACAFVVLKRANSDARRRAAFFVLASFLTIAFLPKWLLSNEGDFWENYFLRTATCDYLSFLENKMAQNPEAGKMQGLEAGKPQIDLSSEEKKEWVLSTVNRQCAAIHSFSLFLDNPLGSSNIQPRSTEELEKLDGWCPSGQLIRFCASCVFPTYWLARAGIAAIPMFLCFIVLLFHAVRDGRSILSWLLIAFGMVLFTWGVMYVPYNVIFQLMLAMPAIAAANERRLKKL